jgi:hypothetical protein
MQRKSKAFSLSYAMVDCGVTESRRAIVSALFEHTDHLTTDALVDNARALSRGETCHRLPHNQRHGLVRPVGTGADA